MSWIGAMFHEGLRLGAGAASLKRRSHLRHGTFRDESELARNDDPSLSHPDALGERNTPRFQLRPPYGNPFPKILGAAYLI